MSRYPIKVVVPVSGGKDSQACLKLALKKYEKNEILGLFCDTRFEHPITYSHIYTMREIYGVEICAISSGSVPEKVMQYGYFPGSAGRFCTSYLKLDPSKKFYKAFAEVMGHGFEVWVGVRSDESPARKLRYIGKVSSEVYFPHEFMSNFPKYLGALGVRFRLPIVDWSVEDVMVYLDGQENPLYRSGFSRVGCFPCLAGGDASKIKAFEHDDFGARQYEKVLILEKAISKSVFESGIGPRWREDGGNGCSICSM
jgi:3'-phosphoadenosine 5'-phosphosulfate sulfotransferase (PAPS reductase)/FAD synthetase